MPLSTFDINSVSIHNTTRRVPQSICYNLLNKSIFDLIHISGMWHVYWNKKVKQHITDTHIFITEVNVEITQTE